MTIGENVILSIPNVASNNVYVMGNAVLTIDGALSVASSNAQLIMKNKATVVVNGTFSGTIAAETGEYIPSVSTTLGNTTFSVTGESSTTKSYGMTGYTLSVGSFSYQKKFGSTDYSVTYQALYIEGDLQYVKTVADSTPMVSAMNIGGNSAYIASGVVLDLKKGMTISVSGYTPIHTTSHSSTTNQTSNLYVLGQIIADSSTVPIEKYIGASYSVKNDATKAVTTYVEPFDIAITKIADADKMTVVVKGDVEISDKLTILENQIVDVRADNANITVKEAGELIVEAKGKVLGTIDAVQGMLKVMKNGTCSAPTSFASKTTSTEYTLYSGIVVALKNAKAGDVVSIINTASTTGDLTIPAGVTVESTAVISIGGKLLVEEGSKVVLKDNSGKIDMTGKKSTIVVKGEIDASEGATNAITFSATLSGGETDNRFIESTGKTTIDNTDFIAAITSKINAFEYTNEDGNHVLTNAQAAIDAVAAMDVYDRVITAYGTVSVGDVVVKKNLVVATGAEISFGKVIINDGYKVTMNGKATGTFSVTTGISDTTGATQTSTIAVNKASGIILSASYVLDSQNVKTYVFGIDGTLVGTAVVKEGTVIIGSNNSSTLSVTGEKNILTIDEGAVLEIPNTKILNVGQAGITNAYTASVIVDGGLVVKGTLAIGYDYSGSDDVADAGIIDINGNLTIGDNVAVTIEAGSIMNVIGTVDISVKEGKEGTLSVSGVLVVGTNTLGANGTVNGKIDILDSSTTAYVKAYAGSDLSNALIDVTNGESAANKSVFFINDIEYMSVYTMGNVLLSTFNTEKFTVSGYTMSTPINWYPADFSSAYDGTQSLNSVKALYTTASVTEVNGTISAGVGLQIYLNGVSVDAYKAQGAGYNLKVGTYTVSIESQYGYDKSTATISFNGTTVVNGGKITVSENGFVLTATGATPADPSTPVTPTPVPTPSEKDDSMGITEYLLIVLVILAAILVVVVAIRMMRS